MAKSCIVCGKRAYSDYCVRHKPRKAISKQGKEFVKWKETKARWFEQNKAPYYFCYLCDKMLTRTTLTLDHVIPRSGAPELRHTLSNLKPCCFPCNSAKGSKRLENM